MATEEYQIGYEAGYQDGWNEAQKPFVGLTDEEMEAAIPFGNFSGEYSYDDILNIILLIQAKLRNKND